nr:PQQ-binding-like beta-propeller repeat protein [Rhodococcus sp. (in: high G+C Gram-positive bacteria)]
MLAPERRRRSDLVAAAALVVVAVLALGIIWLRSDAHGTTSDTAQSPLPQLATATAVPGSLAELWNAPSPITDSPVVTGSAVVTGDGGTVTGLDPRNGSVAWTYSRDTSLCGIASSWNTAVVVYRDDRGCSQATELDTSTGIRSAQRSSDADPDVQLASDGTYLTSRGDTRMELWRSDLVRTLEYGRVDAPVNPNTQPRTGCTLLSSASNSSRVAVLEQCPGESAPRLTSMNPAPTDASQPDEYGSSVVAALTGEDGSAVDGATVLVASGDRVALAIPAHSGRPAAIALFDGTAQPLGSYDLPGTETETSYADTPPPVKAANVFSWWTGKETVALGLSDLAPLWTVPGSLGEGALMAGRLLVPVPDGIAVIDPATGTAERTIAVDRGDYSGPVGTSVIGDVIVEQRGDILTALAAPTT